MLVEPILADLDFTGDDGVIAFVNGMGGTPLLELYVVYNEVATILAKAGVSVARSLVGPYITSLEMAGCSVTLLKVDDELLATVGRAGQDPRPAVEGLMADEPVAIDTAALDRWIRAFAVAIADNEEQLTRLDSAIGDADHGANMVRGMKAVVAKLAESRPPTPPRCSSRWG